MKNGSYCSRRRQWQHDNKFWFCAAAISFIIDRKKIHLLPTQAFLSPFGTRRRSRPFSLSSSPSPVGSTYSRYKAAAAASPGFIPSNQTEALKLIGCIRDCSTIAQVEHLFNSRSSATTTKLPSLLSNHATSYLSLLLSFDVAAAALCKTTKIMAKNNVSSSGQANSIALLPNLLKEIATLLVLVQRPSFRQQQLQQSSSPESLLHFSMSSLADLLISFEWLSLKSKGGPSSFKPLARSVLLLMQRQFILDEKLSLGPFRIWECFQACYHLGLMTMTPQDVFSQSHLIHSNSTALILDTFRDQVTMGNVLAVLPARKLIEGLVIAQSLTQDNTWNMTTAAPLVKAFCRRLRKESVRTKQVSTSLSSAAATAASSSSSRESMHALMTAYQMVQHYQDDAAFQQANLYHELKSMVYIISKEMLQHNEQASSSSSSSSFVTFPQLRQLLLVLVEFQFHLDYHDDENSMVDIVCHRLCSDQTLREASSFYDVRDILRSLAFAKPPIRKHHPELAFQCGQRIYGLVRTDINTTVIQQPHPKLLNTILRCAVLMHKDNQTVLDPYLAACRIIFLDEDFLAASSAVELSNFAWFLSMAHLRGSDHLEMLTALTQRILQTSVLDSMTPKQAVCCLKAFVTLCLGAGDIDVFDGDDDSMLSESSSSSSSNCLHNIVTDLLDGLAGQLLSVQLNQAEASSALYAYAKSNYIQDMGVFDHLTNVMAAQVQRSSVRQVATSLWACGRMMRFEMGRDDDVTQEVRQPPYWRNAQTFVRFLAERSDELNAADTSQALWAIGHLGVEDLDLVTPLLDRAAELTTMLSAQEIANIVWGLSKVLDGRTMTKTMRIQIAQMSKAMLCLHPNPQEISNILYALAILDMADEEIFLTLAHKMMKQMDNAEAQAIANALWAFQTSKLTPPKQLLDLWAVSKLGWIQVPMTTSEFASTALPSRKS